MACEQEAGGGECSGVPASAPLAATSGEYKRNYFDKQRQEHRLGILLVGISILFISCQSFKIIPDVYEVIFCDKHKVNPTAPLPSSLSDWNEHWTVLFVKPFTVTAIICRIRSETIIIK